jgi:cation:H+ antiporter
MDALRVLGGLLALVAGGELLVSGAVGLALLARVSPAVVGLTIVAAGTSMPELVVSLLAAWRGAPDLAVGNVVGSNVFNVAAILGLAALVRPLAVTGSAVRWEWPVMMAAAALTVVAGADGWVGRMEGLILVAGMVAFTAAAVASARRDQVDELATAEDATMSRARAAAGLLGGVVLLAVGSQLLVDGAVGLALVWGVSEAVIGLTIVAAGTSTPELVTSLVASYRGRDDVAVANVLGSNIFNVLAILGVTAVISPLPFAREILARDVWWMLGLSAALLPLMWTGSRISRREGALLLGAFIAYTASLVAAAA